MPNAKPNGAGAVAGPTPAPPSPTAIRDAFWRLPISNMTLFRLKTGVLQYPVRRP